MMHNDARKMKPILKTDYDKADEINQIKIRCRFKTMDIVTNNY